jgi:cell division protein FtsQ
MAKTSKSGIKKLRRPARLRRKWIFVCLALVMVTTGGYFAYQNKEKLVDNTESFIAKAIEAKHILVQVQYTDEVALYDAINMKTGDTLVGVNVASIRKRIESLPWVKLATVTRELPSTLKIEIYEHHPLAKIVVGDEVWVINKKGDRITLSDSRFDGLPTLTGENAAIHAGHLFMLLSEEVKLLKELTAAAYVGERRWDLGFKSGVQVQLPEEDPQQALKILVALNDERKVLAEKHGTIDLRIADRVILRDMK